jgi:hypothetical protein
MVDKINKLEGIKIGSYLSSNKYGPSNKYEDVHKDDLQQDNKVPKKSVTGGQLLPVGPTSQVLSVPFSPDRQAEDVIRDILEGNSWSGGALNLPNALSGYSPKTGGHPGKSIEDLEMIGGVPSTENNSEFSSLKKASDVFGNLLDSSIIVDFPIEKDPLVKLTAIIDSGALKMFKIFLANPVDHQAFQGESIFEPDPSKWFFNFDTGGEKEAVFTSLLDRNIDKGFLKGISSVDDYIESLVKKSFFSSIDPFDVGDYQLELFLPEHADMNSNLIALGTKEDRFSFSDIEDIGEKLVRRNRNEGVSKATTVVPYDIVKGFKWAPRISTTSGGQTSTWGSFYDDQNMFARLSHESPEFGDVLEAPIGALAVANMAIVVANAVSGGGISALNEGIENPYINFFNGLIRESNRNYAKFLKWITFQTLLTTLNPNVKNIDKDSLSNLSLSLFASNESYETVIKARVGDITRRLGPSLLSWLPDPTSFKTGKGKIFNPLRLSSGAGLLMGETFVPFIQAPFLDFPDGPLSYMEWFGDELNPKLNIIREENPYHADKGLGGPSTSKTTNTRVLNTVGRNRLTMKNLPDLTIVSETRKVERALALQAAGDKEGGYKEREITPENVMAIEEKLDAEYCPFYFHDLRTNEIVSFHAFLKSLGQSFSPNWDEKQFYGRSDSVPNLQNTKRTVALSFAVISVNPEDFDIMYEKINKLVTLAYPQFNNGERNIGGNIIPFSQTPIGDPIIRLRVGDYIRTNYNYDMAKRIVGDGEDGNGNKFIDSIHVNFKNYGGKGLAGYITSMDFDISEARWETVRNYVAPQMFQVSINFTAIHDINPGIDFHGNNRAPIFPVGIGTHPSNRAPIFPVGIGTHPSTVSDGNKKSGGSLRETLESDSDYIIL